MLDRRDVLLASISAMAPALPVPAFGQTTSLPQVKGEFLQRPGCKIYYEVAGSGPAIIFAHGLGSNHITWWQQVPYFAERYTCITFSHRGFPPSSEIGIPDPKEFAADLGALIEHLQLSDVRLVAQSMGGWTSVEYLLSNPDHKVRALVLASTCGTIHRPSVPLPEPQRLADWTRKAAAARADMARRGISPPAGERMARERPMLHFLYRTIANASAAFDREQLRTRLTAMATARRTYCAAYPHRLFSSLAAKILLTHSSSLRCSPASCRPPRLISYRRVATPCIFNGLRHSINS
jgi:3-oxoadipate enol-lactonase